MRQSLWAEGVRKTESSRPSWLREQRSRVISMLLWVVAIAGPLGILPGIVNLFRGASFSLTLGIYIIAYMLAVLLLVLRRISDTWRALLLLLMVYAFAVFALYSGWLASSGRTFLVVFVAMAALLIDVRAGFVAAGLSLLTYVAFAAVYSQGVLALRVLPDPTTLPPILTEGGGFIIVIGLMVMASWFFNQAIVATAQATRAAEQARAALAERADELESVNARLDKRTRALTVTAEIAYDVTSVLDVQLLLNRLVELISQRFGFYYAGVFLIDESRQWAILRAAVGEVGQRMLSRNYRVSLDDSASGLSMVREVVTQIENRSRFIDDRVGMDPDWLDTRSELAFPLRVQGTVIGVLDVHHREVVSFDEEDIAVLQTLADQAAVAVNTAQLVQRVEAAAEAERRARGELTWEAWRNLLRVQPDLGYLANRQGVFESPDVWAPEMDEASRTACVVLANDDQERLAMPMRVGGQVIGVLEGRRSGGWSDEEISLLETLVEQLGTTVERARLYRETQRTAARERTISEVTGRIRAMTSTDAILRSAARELGRALQVERSRIQLLPPGESSTEDQKA